MPEGGPASAPRVGAKRPDEEAPKEGRGAAAPLCELGSMAWNPGGYSMLLLLGPGWLANGEL